MLLGFSLFYNIGYSIQIDDEFIGYTNSKHEIEVLINEYLNNTENLNGGYIKMNKNIKYKLAIFFSSKEIEQKDIIYFLRNNSTRYYKMFVLENNGNKLFLLNSGDAHTIANDLNEFSSNENVCISEYYDTFLICSEEAEINKFVSDYKDSTINGYYYSFKKPILRGTVTSRYGGRWGRMHNGIDIADSLGTEIYASQDGSVIFSGNAGAYGNLIKIEHKYGYVTYYAHCNKLLVNVGDYVKQGQLIAKMGSTGRSTGSHVHFEVRHNGKILNPYDCILGD
jgi:murein DD-endopeptidase MepM/ murein hydrolase activator NlpD